MVEAEVHSHIYQKKNTVAFHCFHGTIWVFACKVIGLCGYSKVFCYFEKFSLLKVSKYCVELSYVKNI